ncbi:transcriptional regulator, TetR family [Pseudomonas extremaustralis]|uniref:TetR family transcriptional regulator n=1 Tax=Pseudomonas extremaustralis TaxID=359110 RepID=UPI0009C44D80|nr:TetR family transcriptional regulator [Pseudomonas extremaustralis]SKA80208.1 transcriptional regulator, TetR family [Pseudomonas extremaustralis]
MARTSKEEADKTYGLLLDAAEQVFSQKGYVNATFHEIAERTGLTRGAIYWHFSDKYQLLDAVLRRMQLPWERLPEHFTSRTQTSSLSELCNPIGDAQFRLRRGRRSRDRLAGQWADCHADHAEIEEGGEE